MTEEMIFESDEAEDWESDEAIAEAEESVEDIGERARRRRRRSRYRPGRGVQGISLRGADGGVRKIQFPTKLATANETNRGLANQEVARRAVEERVDRLETKFRVQQNKDSSASGLVSLILAGGLSAWGAIKSADKSTGNRWGDWAGLNLTQMAALTSVSQLSTSGAKLAVNGRYNRSGLGIAADLFAAAQLTAFAIASLYTPEVTQEAESEEIAKTFPKGTVVWIGGDIKKLRKVQETIKGNKFLIDVS